jgi:hypothetical protein
MANHDLQKPLQALPAMLNHIVAKPIRKHLSRQRRDRDARALALQDVAEVFEIAVPAAHAAVSQLEGRDVGPAEDLVVGVHATAHAVGTGIFDLRREGLVGGWWGGEVGGWEGRFGGRVLERGRSGRTSISRKFSGGP